MVIVLAASGLVRGGKDRHSLCRLFFFRGLELLRIFGLQAEDNRRTGDSSASAIDALDARLSSNPTGYSAETIHAPLIR